jgi:hypothetical protein
MLFCGPPIQSRPTLLTFFPRIALNRVSENRQTNSKNQLNTWAEPVFETNSLSHFRNHLQLSRSSAIILMEKLISDNGNL